jgi:hypothetical protein
MGRRTVLLVVSVLIAAAGTGVVATWAREQSARQPVRVERVRDPAPAQVLPSGEPIASSGQVAVTLPVQAVGVSAGTKVDLIDSSGARPRVLMQQVPVLVVRPDGKVTFSVTEADAVRLIGVANADGALTAVVPGPNPVIEPTMSSTTGSSPSTTST